LLVQIDTRFGTFLSLQLKEEPIQRKFISKEAALKSIVKSIAYKKIELYEMEGRLTIFPDVVCISPTLVWQPCWESFSPHLPFYQFTIGDHKIYVRVEIERFLQRLQPEGEVSDIIN